MNIPLCCVNCPNHFKARSGTGKLIHLCQIAGVGKDIKQRSSCPLGHERIIPEEKEHDLTGSVLSLYNNKQ
jgi:hypothetical protein